MIYIDLTTVDLYEHRAVYRGYLITSEIQCPIKNGFSAGLFDCAVIVGTNSSQ